MNYLLSHYICIEPDFFLEQKQSIGEVSGKLPDFIRTLELVRPRFMSSEMKWCGVGHKMRSREKIFCNFLLKTEYHLPTEQCGTSQVGNQG